MPMLRMLMKPDEVNSYLLEHHLTRGYATIDVALMQSGGMGSGQPAVLLVLEVDGRKVVAKTSLQILETMTSAMCAASGVKRAP